MRKNVLMVFAFMAFAIPAPAHADQASAIEAARAVPGVVDAVVDTTGNLYVSVKPNNDPARMKSFAGFVCQVVTPHQGRIFRVRVVDITAVTPSKAPGAWARLAEAKCDGSR